MPRKRTDEHVIPGRPPKDPLNRVGDPVRALVTPRVIEAIQMDMINTGLSGKRDNRVSSDIVRLAIFERLKRQGLMTQELYEDSTWDTLKQSGLV
jgi:hypothetical protein